MKQAANSAQKQNLQPAPCWLSIRIVGALQGAVSHQRELFIRRSRFSAMVRSSQSGLQIECAASTARPNKPHCNFLSLIKSQESVRKVKVKLSSFLAKHYALKEEVDV
jgi:hypothetical protein